MSIRNLLYLFIVAIALSSCKSADDIAPAYKTTLLNVVNADINSLNIYQNGTRIYNASPISPGGTTGYIRVKYGEQQYQLKIAGPDKPDYLFTDYSLTLDTDTLNYSLFIAGETPDKLFKITDVEPTVLPTQATIRFVNTLPGTVNLDATIGSLTFTNKAFTYASAFTYINPGVNAIKIYQSGSTTPLISDVITLAAGNDYTVFTTGTIGGTGANKLTAKLILNVF